MMTNRKVKPAQAPSVRTVAGALIALREVMKKEHGIDVDVEVNIHSWPITVRMARLVAEDMTAGAEGWETDYRSTQTNYDGKDESTLHFIDAKGIGVNKGLEVTIFKREGEKSRRPSPLPRSVKNYCNAAYAVIRVRSLIRELYGVDADVKVTAKVDVSKYSFIRSVNPHVTKEAAADILSTIASGTDWVHRDEVFSYYHHFKLYGTKVEFDIYFELPREKEFAQSADFKS